VFIQNAKFYIERRLRKFQAIMTLAWNLYEEDQRQYQQLNSIQRLWKKQPQVPTLSKSDKYWQLALKQSKDDKKHYYTHKFQMPGFRKLLVGFNSMYLMVHVGDEASAWENRRFHRFLNTNIGNFILEHYKTDYAVQTYREYFFFLSKRYRQYILKNYLLCKKFSAVILQNFGPKKESQTPVLSQAMKKSEKVGGKKVIGPKKQRDIIITLEKKIQDNLRENERLQQQIKEYLQNKSERSFENTSPLLQEIKKSSGDKIGVGLRGNEKQQVKQNNDLKKTKTEINFTNSPMLQREIKKYSLNLKDKMGVSFNDKEKQGGARNKDSNKTKTKSNFINNSPVLVLHPQMKTSSLDLRDKFGAGSSVNPMLSDIEIDLAVRDCIAKKCDKTKMGKIAFQTCPSKICALNIIREQVKQKEISLLEKKIQDNLQQNCRFQQQINQYKADKNKTNFKDSVVLQREINKFLKKKKWPEFLKTHKTIINYTISELESMRPILRKYSRLKSLTNYLLYKLELLENYFKMQYNYQKYGYGLLAGVWYNIQKNAQDSKLFLYRLATTQSAWEFNIHTNTLQILVRLIDRQVNIYHQLYQQYKHYRSIHYVLKLLTLSSEQQKYLTKNQKQLRELILMRGRMHKYGLRHYRRHSRSLFKTAKQFDNFIFNRVASFLTESTWRNYAASARMVSFYGLNNKWLLFDKYNWGRSLLDIIDREIYYKAKPKYAHRKMRNPLRIKKRKQKVKGWIFKYRNNFDEGYPWSGSYYNHLPHHHWRTGHRHYSEMFGRQIYNRANRRGGLLSPAQRHYIQFFRNKTEEQIYQHALTQMARPRSGSKTFSSLKKIKQLLCILPHVSKNTYSLQSFLNNNDIVLILVEKQKLLEKKLYIEQLYYYYYWMGYPSIRSDFFKNPYYSEYAQLLEEYQQYQLMKKNSQYKIIRAIRRIHFRQKLFGFVFWPKLDAVSKNLLSLYSADPDSLEFYHFSAAGKVFSKEHDLTQQYNQLLFFLQYINFKKEFWFLFYRFSKNFYTGFIYDPEQYEFYQAASVIFDKDILGADILLQKQLKQKRYRLYALIYDEYLKCGEFMISLKQYWKFLKYNKVLNNQPNRFKKAVKLHKYLPERKKSISVKPHKRQFAVILLENMEQAVLLKTISTDLLRQWTRNVDKWRASRKKKIMSVAEKQSVSLMRAKENRLKRPIKKALTGTYLDKIQHTFRYNKISDAVLAKRKGRVRHSIFAKRKYRRLISYYFRTRVHSLILSEQLLQQKRLLQQQLQAVVDFKRQQQDLLLFQQQYEERQLVYEIQQLRMQKEYLPMQLPMDWEGIIVESQELVKLQEQIAEFNKPVWDIFQKVLRRDHVNKMEKLAEMLSVVVVKNTAKKYDITRGYDKGKINYNEFLDTMFYLTNILTKRQLVNKFEDQVIYDVLPGERLSFDNKHKRLTLSQYKRQNYEAYKKYRTSYPYYGYFLKSNLSESKRRQYFLKNYNRGSYILYSDIEKIFNRRSKYLQSQKHKRRC
jgi:hypothetical protein